MQNSPSPKKLLNSLFHSTLPPYVSGKCRLGHKLTLRVRADARLGIERILLRSTPEGEEIFTPLERQGYAEGGVQWWQVTIAINVPLFDYRFFVYTECGNYWLAAAGCTRHTPLDSGNYKLLSLDGPPDWVPEAVIYQIFPDRFCNGDDSLSVKSGEYMLGSDPVLRVGWDEFNVKLGHGHVFCGGDLPGIISKLDYIQNLGVDTLYLNPIFVAPSNHKYDVADYYNVDAHLGGNEALIALRRALSERGMHLVLDVVPNHCGAQNSWFLEAQRNPYAPEAAFFTFTNHPHEYECWLGVSSLPRFNYASTLLCERMYGSGDSVFRHWLRPPYSIDGWRLDVANMLGRRGRHQLGHKVGRAIRRAVKDENQQAWILGEHFFDGTSHLQGNELDATMNYRGFAVPLLQWLCGRNWAELMHRGGYDDQYLDTDEFVTQLDIFRTSVPEAIALEQMNLIDSHDTPRFLTMAGGDVERLKVAVAFLFAYQGVPCVYYGDEVGLEGGPDPDCRRPMPWDEAKWDRDLLGYYSALGNLRRRSSALKVGSLQMLAPAQGVAFLRQSAEERIIATFNRGPVGGDAAQPERELEVSCAGVADGTRWREFLSGREAQVVDGYLPAMPAGLGACLWEEVKV